MKKSLVSALTTALVVGAASTTFAAANPFEDVPADHWAYDAIAQLAADGVIEGYGDGTYRGDQEITRYEMAQMVARAMAKNPSGADKAYVDKLAAEFHDELNSLGVRVAALEKKVDNVKWKGKLRYRYAHRTQEGSDADRTNLNQLLLRFEPQMQINKHWTGKARIDYGTADNMNTAKNETSVKVERMWVAGDYKNFKINLGKIPYKSQADEGLIMDRNISGGQLIFGSGVKVALNMGRVNDNDNSLISFGATASGTQRQMLRGAANANGDFVRAASYGSIEVYGDKAKKFTWGLGWHQFRQSQELRNIIGNDSYNIWALGLGYKFTGDLRLSAAYARANSIDDDANGNSWNGSQKYSWSAELAYKGAKASKPGSWGIFAAYRHLGAFSSTGWNTYRLNGPQGSGEKGFEIGVSWAPMKNVTGIVRYFNGKRFERFSGDEDVKTNAIFTEWNFLF